MPIEVDLQEENAELRRRLEEAEETIRAIREGDVDALVVAEPGGERVYTLTTADRPYRLLLEQMQQGAATLEADGTILWCNERLAAALGMPHARLIGAKLHEFIAASDRPNYDSLLQLGIRGIGQGETNLQRADGGQSPAYLTFNVLPADCGAAVGVLVTDLTAQKHQEQLAAAHEALRKSEQRYRMLFETIDEGFCIIEFLDGPRGPMSDYVHVEANPAYTLNAGIPDIVGKKVCEIVPDEADGWVEIYRRVLLTGEPVRFERELVATGRYLELSAFRIEPVERRQVAVLFKDITGRKQAADALRESEEMRRFSQQAAGIGTWTWDKGSGIVQWSSETYELFGIDPHTTLLYESWCNAVHPDDRERADTAAQHAMQRGENLDVEYRINHPSRGERWLNSVGRIIDPVKRPGYMTGISMDITERKQAEDALRRHQETLEETVMQRTEEAIVAQQRVAASQRMAAVGTLASGLAHDISNVLLPLGMRLDMLLTHASVDGATHDHLTAVQGLMVHLREMSKNLALFARDPDKEGIIGETNLSDWWQRVFRLLESSVRDSGVRLDCDVPKDLPAAAIAPHRLTQVVLNLVQNGSNAISARRAAAEPGTPASAPGTVKLVARKGTLIDSSPAITLQVIDDGCGMNEETKRRCIEPFFTTRDRPSVPGTGGSGMGLSLAHSIVERAGGTLEVESAPGQGTTITMRIPIAAPSSSKKAADR